MNFYNEHDPKAAAWLRELIAAKLIPDGIVDERSITEAPKLQAGSSYDQADYGTSGIAPKPFPATWSSLFGDFFQRAQIVACERFPTPASHRRIDTNGEHLDSKYRNASDCCQGRVFCESSPDIRFAYLDELDETCEPMPQIARGGNHQSKSTCCSGRGQSQCENRKRGRSALRTQAREGSRAAISPYTSWSSIFGECASSAFRLHTERKKGFQSCGNRATSLFSTQ